MKKLYAVKDLKGVYFGKIMDEFHNDQDASRAMGHLVNDKKESSMISNYPSDFELWQVGEYDDSTGKLNSELRMVLNLGNLVLSPQKEGKSENANKIAETT